MHHSTRLLHVGGPSALTAQVVASIRRGRGLDAEDLGSAVYLCRKTSTNRNCAMDDDDGAKATRSKRDLQLDEGL
jgi:hypothetical protein